MPFVIDDSNFWTFQTSDDPSRLVGGCFPRIVPPGGVVCASLDIPLIPRSQWRDLIKRREDERATLRELHDASGLKIYNQETTYYCHANATAKAMEIMRVAAGLPPVHLSPGSIGGPVTGYLNRGACITKDLEVASSLGCAEQSFVPPNQITKGGWKTGAAENARKHRIERWFDGGSKDREMFGRLVSSVLSNRPAVCAWYWWGHATTIFDIRYDDGEYIPEGPNSWGEEWGDRGYCQFRGSRSTPDAFFVPVAVTPQ